MKKSQIWINTRVELQWNKATQQYDEISVEGYWADADSVAYAHNSPNLDQDSYAFYNDGTESGSTIIGTANNPQTLDSDTTYLVRFLLQEDNGGASANFTAQLEYDVNNSGTFNNVTSTSNNVRAVTSGSLGTDGANTTQRLGSGTFLTTNGGVDNGDGAAGGANLDFAGNDEAEVVYAIQFRNADLTDQDTVQLRVASMNTYTRTASATINVSLAAITGTLSTQETGSDAFSGTGDVDVSGSLTAQESGSDTFASSGGVTVAGSLSAQESGADTFAASGTVTDPAITGGLTAQETGSDTFSASGGVTVAGGLTAQESGSDTFAASGAVTVSGSFTAQESGADTLSASGSVSVTGSLVAQESGADTLSASGTVSDPSILGSLVAQETGADTLSVSGGVAVVGSLAVQETGSDTASMTGAVISGIVGQLVAQEVGADTANFIGNVVIDAVLAAVESGADTVTITGVVVDRPDWLPSYRFTVSLPTMRKTVTIDTTPTKVLAHTSAYTVRMPGQLNASLAATQITVRIDND